LAAGRPAIPDAAALSETKKLLEEARTELDQAEGETQN
jgi:hypothetical protein